MVGGENREVKRGKKAEESLYLYNYIMDNYNNKNNFKVSLKICLFCRKNYFQKDHTCYVHRYGHRYRKSQQNINNLIQTIL